MSKDKVLDFSKSFDDLDKLLGNTKSKADSLLETQENQGQAIEDIKEALLSLGVSEDMLYVPDETVSERLDELDITIRDLSSAEFRGDFNLSPADIIVSIAAGVIASVIDIFLVGSPEVVKIYKGGENFDGSVLTKALRSIGNGDDRLSAMLNWLCEKCTVPYDIPAVKDVMYPGNHRLRSFSHDPFIGLFFAVADIVLGTATVVDDSGKIRILVNPKDYSDLDKRLAVLYYLGHLLSDVCTARGLPIPGFILTQFFTDGDDNSIASIAEEMYRDGYDARHLASMSSAVFIKNFIIDLYLYIIKQDSDNILRTIAEKEIDANREKAYKYRLRLISDAVSCGGNVAKFFVPPTMGNWTALNLPEWISLIRNTILELQYQLRDKDVEAVIANREIINDNWRALLKET